MATGYSRPATIGDAKWLAPRLRAADRAECLALIGKTPEAFLPGSLSGALCVNAMVANDGTLLGLFGLHPVPRLSQVGAVWLVATDDLEKHSTTFLRQSRAAVDALHALRPALVNFTDARNTLHHKWLRWCGFTFLAHRERFGPEQLPFIEFAKVKS